MGKNGGIKWIPAVFCIILIISGCQEGNRMALADFPGNKAFHAPIIWTEFSTMWETHLAESNLQSGPDSSGRKYAAGPVPPDGADSERPDTDHDSFRMQVKDGAGEFFVEMEAQPAENQVDLQEKPMEERYLLISIYEDEGKTRLLQQLEAVAYDCYFQDVRVEDVDFDGYMDFYWPSMKGAANWEYTYYIWDEAASAFVFDPYGLSSLTSPDFDPESRTIKSSYVVNWQAGGTSYWNYQDGGLACIRSIVLQVPDYEAGVQVLYVKDLEGGRMAEVYRAGLPMDLDMEELEREYEKASKWADLDYHG